MSEDGSNFVRPADRIAAFDNDGTLWCEKPMPIQLDFILRRLYAMAEEQPDLQVRECISIFRSSCGTYAA